MGLLAIPSTIRENAFLVVIQDIEVLLISDKQKQYD